MTASSDKELTLGTLAEARRPSTIDRLVLYASPVAAVVSVAVAWGANGSKIDALERRASVIESSHSDIQKDLRSIGERTARIETGINMLTGRSPR